MDKLKEFMSRDTVSDEAKVKVIQMLEEINSTITVRVYSNNDYIKELLDKGRYSDVEAVSEVFRSIVQKCKDSSEALSGYLQSLPDAEVLGKGSNK